MLVGIKEAATALGVSPQTLYRLIGEGELSVVKIGDRTLFRLDDLQEFIEQHTRRREGEHA